MALPPLSKRAEPAKEHRTVELALYGLEDVPELGGGAGAQGGSV